RMARGNEKMRTLKEVIEEAGAEKNGLMYIKPELKAFNRNREFPVVVKAILERTAVVFPIGHVHATYVAKLEDILVEKEEIEWFPKSKNDQSRYKSSQRGGINTFLNRLREVS